MISGILKRSLYLGTISCSMHATPAMRKFKEQGLMLPPSKRGMIVPDGLSLKLCVLISGTRFCQ